MRFQDLLVGSSGRRVVLFTTHVVADVARVRARLAVLVSALDTGAFAASLSRGEKTI